MSQSMMDLDSPPHDLDGSALQLDYHLPTSDEREMNFPPPLEKRLKTDSDQSTPSHEHCGAKVLYIVGEHDGQADLYRIFVRPSDGKVLGSHRSDMPVHRRIFSSGALVTWTAEFSTVLLTDHRNLVDPDSVQLFVMKDDKGTQFYKSDYDIALFDPVKDELTEFSPSKSPIQQPPKELCASYFHRPSSFLIGAFGRLYALAVSTFTEDRTSCSFRCYHPIKNSWETLKLDPVFTSSNLMGVAGYVIVKQHQLVLFCLRRADETQIRPEFRAFHVLNQCLYSVKLNVHPSLSMGSQPAPDYQPFYGKAEYVDDCGVIVGHHVRVIVMYRLTVKPDHEKEDGFSCSMELLRSFNLEQQVKYSAYGESPFGAPSLYSRTITRLDDINNVFCVVETETEIPGEIVFQPVFFTTFKLFLPVGEQHVPQLDILHSTLRLVEVSSPLPYHYITYCYSPSIVKHESESQLVSTSTSNLCSNLEEHYLQMVPAFCREFFYEVDDMYLKPFANKLYSKYRDKLESSLFANDEDVQLFCAIMSPDTVDPFKFLKQQAVLDSASSLDRKRSVYFVSDDWPKACALYELNVLERSY